MTKGLEIWLHHLGDKEEYSLFAFGKHRSYECMGGRIGINRKTGQVDVISIPGRSRKHPNQLPWSAGRQKSYLFTRIVIPMRNIAFLKHYMLDILRITGFENGWTFIGTYEHFHTDTPECDLLRLLQQQRLHDGP